MRLSKAVRNTVGAGICRYKPADEEMSFPAPPSLRTPPLYFALQTQEVFNSHSKAICNHSLFTNIDILTFKNKDGDEMSYDVVK